MFDRGSSPLLTIRESVVELADFAVESADSTADSCEDPVKNGLWVCGFYTQVPVDLTTHHEELVSRKVTTM